MLLYMIRNLKPQNLYELHIKRGTQRGASSVSLPPDSSRFTHHLCRRSFSRWRCLAVSSILTAIEDGCTHILVIRTRTDNTSPAILWSGQHLVAQYLQHMSSGLGVAYLNTTKQYRQIRKHIQKVSESQVGPPFMLDVTCPTGVHKSNHFYSGSRNPFRRNSGAGYSAMMEALESGSYQAYLRPVLFNCSEHIKYSTDIQQT